MRISGFVRGAGAAQQWDDRTPIGGELFSIERLEEHAKSLAAAQRLRTSPTRGQQLTQRLADNAAFLLKVNVTIGQAAERGVHVTPAAEWLIDNYHLVDMQIREIGIDLPRGYYAQLPKLADGPFVGLPRVFGATWSLAAHTDCHFDPITLRRYLTAYQDIEILTIGELWAVPITLRIVLIENLRRVAAMIAENALAREAADKLADRLIGTDLTMAPDAAEVLAAVGNAPLTDAFAVQLAHRVRGRDPAKEPARVWLEKRLAPQGKTIEMAVNDELAQQGAFNATVQNLINSLRLIAGIDWTEEFEGICAVDRVLAEHSAFYAMDFPTRNLYRNAIEQLARGSSTSEIDIARMAAASALQQNSVDGSEHRETDTGYFLLGSGRSELETAIGYRPSVRACAARTCRRLGISFYGAAVITAAALLLSFPLTLCAHAGIGAAWLVILAALGFIPASDAAVACVNRAVMWAFGATALPGLELRDGIPVALGTLVAVPTLLTTPQAARMLVAQLEVHFLASQDGAVHFALLTDWTDSEAEHEDNDEAVLQAAEDGVATLNRKYGPGPGGTRFFLLHRKRKWNEGEGRWIGWERKRGKLHELNRLLRGATDTSFLARSGQPLIPSDIRYVVTLDSDTRLPHDAVRRLVGKMAHPLNVPRFDPQAGRVVEGYAVLQPRVTPSLPVGRETSLFERVFSSMDGIDPYAAAVSDVYQDMFGEGSYAGKGIYDVDGFEAALAGRVPESSLLSHDLFEGLFARAGLASDVEVVEEFPSSYAVAALRQHRWARGDWQLLPWILPSGIGGQGHGAARTAMPTIGRWKMLDNLRRTLSAPATMLAFVVGFLLPTGAALIWTGALLSAIILPTMLPVAADVMPRRQWITLASYAGVLTAGLRHAFTLSLLNVVFLAHQSCLMGDAIVRTLVRVFVTRRHLLQWVTAAQADQGPILTLGGTYRRMGGAPLAGLFALALSVVTPHGWIVALPFALLWSASPAVAFYASRRSVASGRPAASETDIATLRVTARRTWHFFETFVTPLDNMLPPDNFQEDPVPVIAHRTSPTNLGLYLLATVSAHDFGWTGLEDTVARLEATMASMARLPRFRGHFYNWYDTSDLRALEPAYVSTVDSGNLAGHLITLASACLTWQTEETHHGAWRDGAADALALAAETLPVPDGRTHHGALEAALMALVVAIRAAPASGRPGVALISQATAFGVLAKNGAPYPVADQGAEFLFWAQAVRACLVSNASAGDLPATLKMRLAAIEVTARAMANDMEFGFLRNDARKLLSIGFLVADGTLDVNCYDLLASEARLAVFVAIAKGDVPAREWFRMGRAVTPVGRSAALVSWSGSMFEYLMPSLVMRAPGGSLLEETSRLVVRRQIAFGLSRGLPWGVSESAYNVRDLEYTYQYSNFGVPGLGLKRGLGRDAVVAPYATLLAAMVDAPAAVRNLARLATAGARGRYGFYEAMDYTPGRVPTGADVAVVRGFMAHHQGMSILAAADTVLSGIMRARFHTEPMIKATELLLQERAPRGGAVARPLPAEERRAAADSAYVDPGGRRFTTAHGEAPATHLLSNGNYSVMLTSAGSLRRCWQEFAVTRWREDATTDSSGAYIYVRDTVGGKVWSVGVQPTGAEPDDYEVAFSEDRATFARRDGSLTTTVEILVASDEDADVQLVTLYNSGDETRVIELTSYAELALAPQATDLVHPAFAKLFVQTEHVAEPSGGGALIATRRRRTETEPEIWAAHLVVAEGPVQHETDRARFIGRGRGVRSPAALRGSAPLSGSTGTVLDAVFALRCRVTVPPGGAARVAFWTLVAGSRAALLDCIDKHRDAAAFDRASTLAWARAQVLLRHIGISPRQADLFQDLAGHLLFPGTALRAGGASIMAGAGPQSGLWSRAISGDLPILLLRISDGADVDIAAQLILAHEYFRLKQFYIDLVILDDHPSSYAQDLQASLEGLIRAGSRPGTGQGAIFLLRSDMIPPATTALLIATARVVLTGSRGTLSEQLASPKPPQSLARVPAAARPPPVIVPGRPALPPLEFQNGYGGFTDNAAIYVIVLGPGRCTPAPWINVIANESFGFLVSAEGCGYSWSGNSRENQLTPWSNDPVTDDAGEAVFLQEGKALWSATAGVRRDVAATYVTRHGKGFSRFDRVVNDIESSLLTYVPLDAPLKISRLTLRNGSGRRRSIAVTFYAAWVLGPARSTTAAFVTTEMDGETGAMFARNRWGTAPHDRVAFADLGGRQSDWSGDRRAFIGRNGSLNDPAALATLAPLPGGVGAGLDPCCAMRTLVEIPENGSLELVFFLGEAPTAEEASRLIKLYREKDLDQVLADIHRHWQDVLCAVQVKTPDRAMDIMLNGWLVYQTLASRIQARAGFYQASGAYGFRDQLQDGMALTAACPGLVRRHLLRAAAVQFTEGDVLHWWLPESGRGVRTRISDDCAWLAYTVAHYVTATGDTGVLDEKIGYLSAPGLAAAEPDRFFLPAAATQDGTLYEHCARALDHSLALGGHGLPLIGTGDWNDGMNRIGSAGRGESVWLGWFLHDALAKLATIAEARHDYDHAGSWRAHATDLSDALEAAWDGDRYVRAYFDDGTPLGGQGGAAAGIDAIAQSWAVISAAGQPERAACAMASVTRDLVKDGLLLVLAPPFDSEGPDPGYIRGYPPGVRENGGQYTHAAMWTVLAETMLGHGAEATRMFAMLNPINHAVTERAAEKYKLEPYVLAADIYSVAPHVGRGGWSWYTGSAGWMQRVGIENILGVKIRGDTLLIDPCIAPGWAEYEVNIRWQSARYVITVKNPAHVCRGVKTISCDGVELPAPDAIRMLNDGASHDVRVLLG